MSEAIRKRMMQIFKENADVYENRSQRPPLRPEYFVGSGIIGGAKVGGAKIGGLTKLDTSNMKKRDIKKLFGKGIIGGYGTKEGASKNKWLKFLKENKGKGDSLKMQSKLYKEAMMKPEKRKRRVNKSKNVCESDIYKKSMEIEELKKEIQELKIMKEEAKEMGAPKEVIEYLKEEIEDKREEIKEDKEDLIDLKDDLIDFSDFNDFNDFNDFYEDEDEEDFSNFTDIFGNGIIGGKRCKGAKPKKVAKKSKPMKEKDYKKGASKNEWLKFVKKHKGQGYSLKELSKMYKMQ
jgi:hypothetical protein